MNDSVSFRVWFIEDSGLLRVQFIQDSALFPWIFKTEFHRDTSE
jgi:hypothetical protein